MKIEIINTSLALNIYGFSGTAINKDYSGLAFKLADKMWQLVKSGGLKNKGINIWVYEPGEYVFAGVELYEVPGHDTGLELKTVNLTKYAYYKHTGPYSQLQNVGREMRTELMNNGHEAILPHVEIYGHWTGDEATAETEMLMQLK
jgi:hypothetical protein